MGLFPHACLFVTPGEAQGKEVGSVSSELIRARFVKAFILSKTLTPSKALTLSKTPTLSKALTLSKTLTYRNPPLSDTIV